MDTGPAHLDIGNFGLQQEITGVHLGAFTALPVDVFSGVRVGTPFSGALHCVSDSPTPTANDCAEADPLFS